MFLYQGKVVSFRFLRFQENVLPLFIGRFLKFKESTILSGKYIGYTVCHETLKSYSKCKLFHETFKAALFWAFLELVTSKASA